MVPVKPWVVFLLSSGQNKDLWWAINIWTEILDMYNLSKKYWRAWLSLSLALTWRLPSSLMLWRASAILGTVSWTLLHQVILEDTKPNIPGVCDVCWWWFHWIVRGSRNYLESSQKPGCLGSSDHTGQWSPGKQAGSGVPLVTTEIQIFLQYLWDRIIPNL